MEAVSALVFEVPGLPKPKARPRVAFRDRQGRTLAKPRTFTPKGTRTYEKRVAWAAHQAIAALSGAWFHFRSWLALEVYAFVPNPNVGDGDNFLKAVADGLQGVVYENDRQVLDWSVKVRSCLVGEPRLVVTVKPLYYQAQFPEKPKKKRARRAKAVSRA